MANLVYVNQGTAITWQDTAGTYAMTLNNLGAGAGRQGAIHDWGVGARASRFAWRFWTVWATTPVVGESIRIYAKTSDGTSPDNDDGTGDIAVSAANKLKNLREIGRLIVDEAADVLMVKSGVVYLYQRYFMPVVWNATADNLKATNDTAGFSLTPMPDEVQ